LKVDPVDANEKSSRHRLTAKRLTLISASPIGTQKFRPRKNEDAANTQVSAAYKDK